MFVTFGMSEQSMAAYMAEMQAVMRRHAGVQHALIEASVMWGNPQAWLDLLAAMAVGQNRR